MKQPKAKAAPKAASAPRPKADGSFHPEISKRAAKMASRSNVHDILYEVNRHRRFSRFFGIKSFS